MADAFKELGVRGLIATRLDIARRIGAVLTAAATGDFDLLAFTADASVAEPPRPFNAVALARILLPDDYVRDAAPPAPAPLWQSRRPA
jgi:flagellar biosynthesis protein FlhF